jgi:HEAT repeat protein
MTKWARSFTVSAVLTIVVFGGFRSAEKPSLTQQDQVVQMIRAGPDGLELAVQTLRNSSDARLREVAAYVIGEYGKRELATVLADSLTDSTEQVRRSAITAPQKLVNPEVLKQDRKTG